MHVQSLGGGTSDGSQIRQSVGVAKAWLVTVSWKAIRRVKGAAVEFWIWKSGEIGKTGRGQVTVLRSRRAISR